MIAVIVAGVLVAGVTALLVVRRRQVGSVGRHAAGGAYLRAPSGQLRADVGSALNPLLPAAGRAGLWLMSGKTAKYLRFLGRTLTWRSAPADAIALVSATVVATKLFTPIDPDDGQYAAWSGNSTTGPRLLLVLRAAADLPGHVQLGIERFDWFYRFPQGGLFMNRVARHLTPVFAAAGIDVRQTTAVFEPIPDRGGPYEGTWRRVSG